MMGLDVMHPANWQGQQPAFAAIHTMGHGVIPVDGGAAQRPATPTV